MELDRCECCGTVNLQWIDGYLLCRHSASSSTRSEASRAITTHEGRRKLVMGMPQDAFRSGQERYHAHINGVEIHPTLEQTCAAAMLRLGERPPPGSTPSKRPEGSR